MAVAASPKGRLISPKNNKDNTGNKEVGGQDKDKDPDPGQDQEDVMGDDTVAEAKEDSRRSTQPSYEFRPKPCHESKYCKELLEASKRGPKPVDPFEQPVVDLVEELAEIEKLDPLHRRRVHAWVLVRAGKRDVQENFFLEPSTGRAYPCVASPYYSIEAMWNHKNYFVNCHTTTDPAELSLDVTNNDVWEYVMIDPFNVPPKPAGSAANGDQEMGFDQEFGGEGSKGALQEAKKMELNEHILDIPLSWVSKLHIDRELFRLRYPPRGGRVTLYHKAKLELYSENTHEEGLVCRVTLYLDLQRSLVKERREHFKNRVDHLQYRIRYPMERKVHEVFHPGRPGSLREWVEWLGQRRVLHYYVSARLDGLVSREELFGHKIIETFENRPDGLVYRSVHMSSDVILMSKLPYTLQDAGPAGDMVVEKMTEKYARDPSRHAHEDMAKRTYYVADGRIRTLYHYDDARVTRPASVIIKDRSATSTTPGTMVVGDDVVVLEEDQLQQALIAEKECFTAIRHSQMEMIKLAEKRTKEEQVVKLERPIYERVWDRSGESTKKEGEDLDGDDVKDYRRVDYLTPFLQNIKDANNMTKDEARHVRDACLKALKERLLERANIIQTRLNEETVALSKIQANFQRSQQSSDENVEEYERYCSEALFRIGILESRLASHEDSALKKYAAMDDKLSNDPRLLQALRT